MFLNVVMRASKMAWWMGVPTKSDDLTPTLGRHRAEESWILQGPLPHTATFECDHC